MMMLLEIAVKGFLVLAAGGVLTACLRRRSAAARHLVWGVAVMAVLALPLLVAVTPRSSVPVAEDTAFGAFLADLLPAQEVAVSVNTPPGEAVTRGGASEPHLETTGVDVLVDPLDASRAADFSASTEPSEAVAGDQMVDTVRGRETVDVAASSGRPLDPFATTLLIWIAGTLLVLAALIIERLRLTRIERAARPCIEGPVLESFHRIAREAGCGNRATLRIGERDAMPMTWGALRPIVLLPADSESWSRRRLESVLRHELAHVQRHDDLVQLAATLVAALHWFDPLVWFAIHRLRVEREHACDDVVLRRGARPSAYAEELLGIAHEFKAARATALVAQSMARPSQLSTRLLAVLEESRSRHALSRRQVVTGAGLGLLLAFPLAAVALAIVPPRVGHAGRAVVAGAAPQTPELASAGSPELLAGRAAQSRTSECWDPSVERRASNMSNTDTGISTFVWSSDGCRGEIRVEGELSFNDEVTEITGISAGGELRIEIEEDGTERRLEITRGATGGLEYAWLIDGRLRDFDSDAQQWLSGILEQVLRATGIAAEERTAAIYRRQGAQGVFDEIALMSSNSVISRYLIALIDQPGVGDGDIVRILEIAGNDIDSNSSKYRVLVAVGRSRRDSIVGGPLEASFWENVATIDSNSTMSRLLGALIQGEPVDSALVTRSVREAGARIDSNSTLANFLLRLKRNYPGIATSGPQAALYWETLNRIDSNSTLRGVLMELTAGETIDSTLLPVVFETARARINSNSALREFLVTMDSAYPGIAESGPMADQYWETVGMIDSDSHLSRTLLDIARNKADASGVLDQVLDEGREGIGSDSQMRRFLIAFVEQHRAAAAGRLQDQILATAGTIGSDSHRRRTMSALQDLGIGQD